MDILSQPLEINGIKTERYVYEYGFVPESEKIRNPYYNKIYMLNEKAPCVQCGNVLSYAANVIQENAGDTNYVCHICKAAIYYPKDFIQEVKQFFDEVKQEHDKKMRLYKFLNEAVIKPDTSGFQKLIPTILKQTKGKSGIQVITALNKIFKEHFIVFKQVNRQASDDELAAAGISYSDIETKEPYKITIYLNDTFIFEDDPDEVEQFGLPAVYRLLTHEMIHRQQFARMQIQKQGGFKSFKEYHGDSHELMTLAHDMMLYMLGQGLTKDQMKNALRNTMNGGDFENFKEFSKYYKPDSPEYKQLVKYLYQYIDKLA